MTNNKTKRKFKVDKLIRDKIIELDDGILNFVRILEHGEYLKKLNDKLLEEAQEVINAKNLQEITEELADLQEVLCAIADANNIEIEEIDRIKKEKARTRGGFRNKVFLNYIEISSDHKKLSYYLANPNKYPEIK